MALTPSDSDELLRRTAGGDPAALDQMLVRHLERLRKMIARRLDQRLAARLDPSDVVQEVLAEAASRLPEGRYQTAHELADDLRRFLKGRPVLAARPTLLDRLSRRVRRHRSAVAMVAVGLLLALVGLLIADVVLWQEREKTKKALEKAERNVAEADRQRRCLRLATALAS